MTPAYTIAAARARDLPVLPALELAAVTVFDGHGLDDVPHEPTSHEALARAQRDGLLWVALADDVPVGFAHVALVEPDAAHLEEIDVHPEHGRRGLGTRLIMRVCEWAAAAGYESVTLTTFREIPWNMPFYARLGFEVVPPDTLGRALRFVVEDERRRGLDPALRVVMKRPSLIAASRVP